MTLADLRKGHVGFSIVELLVAILIASVGMGGLLLLFTNTAHSAARSADLSQAQALGRGLIAEWQAMPAQRVRALLSQGDGAWPEQPVAFESSEKFAHQWTWEGDLPESGSIPLTLRITSVSPSEEEAVEVTQLSALL